VLGDRANFMLITGGAAAGGPRGAAARGWRTAVAAAVAAGAARVGKTWEGRYLIRAPLFSSTRLEPTKLDAFSLARARPMKIWALFRRPVPGRRTYMFFFVGPC
jgi:hypothetical protein